MNTSEIKLALFRQIDAMDKDKLEKLYGILLNFISSEEDSSQWESLTNEQQQGFWRVFTKLCHF